MACPYTIYELWYFLLDLLPTHKENDSMLWYLVLRGASSFLMETGRWPGSSQPYTTTFKFSSNNQNQNSTGIPVPREEQFSATDSEQLDMNIIESDLPTLRIHLNRVLQSFGIATNRVSTDYLEVMYFIIFPTVCNTDKNELAV